MRAQAGDWLVAEGRDINHHARRGRIISVAPGGEPPFRVQWADDGHEGLVFPGPDCHVVPDADPRAEDFH